MAEKGEKFHHKIEHKETEHYPSKKENTRTYVVAAIILLIAIIFVYTKYYNVDSQTVVEKVVIASINEEEITLDELKKAYQSVPSQNQATLTKKDLLGQMIEARLLFQEAKKQGFEVSDEKAAEQLEIAKKMSGLTQEQFQQFLTQQKITEIDLITQIKKQVSVQLFLNSTVYSKIEISEESIKNYYNTNKDKFKTGEQVTVKHILIGNESQSDEEKNETAQRLLKEVNKDNFCEYVNRYSTDVGSIEKCGEYSFSKDDPLVQAFKDLSFTQPAGKIGIAKTEYGYHLIWTVKKIPAKTLSYNEVKEQIRTFLVGQKSQEAYKRYYEGLLQDNVIRITFDESADK